jgi:Spy/CpxP family protein refolding chaperone
MKKLCIATLVALIPLAMFAQAPADKPMNRPADRQIELLKSFKLSDAQIAQIQDIEKSTRTILESDSAHLQLLNSQKRVALLPASGNVDLSAINKLIDQKAQLRAEMEKALVSAQVQLTQIMGKEDFDKFFREYRELMPRGDRFGMGDGEFMRGPMGNGPEGKRGGMMGE